MLNNFLLALHFLTGISLTKKLEASEKALAESTRYFPLIGILIGCILAFVNFLFSLIFPPTVVGAILLISLIWIARGFHLDGFIDTIDGLFGGMNRDERLKIMRDTQIGAFGVIAVICLFLLKFTLFLELSGEDAFPLILVLMPAFGRWSMICAMPLYPYPREKGTGAFAKSVRLRDVLIASIIMFIFAIGLLRLKGLILIIGISIFMLLISRYISSKIGGMTGDTYGALNELIEVFVLALFYPLIQIL